ncbi:N-acetylglucosamine kinase [Natronospirillum operosum]|uniref:N-acetylglucosamine kinase n=1 Tax=Natronospirillum operosum TaxID=2759953 RepID=A0A4Z0WGB7_9GAMM|nr:BadF/BadG/BcrA/BcrD ATPase family protein [Natronospirillum operosum]TGG94231.1 N-acetylglucosamine kinase [Natronospirillum operosum]
MNSAVTEEPLYVGVDGGGTGCRGRLENAAGDCLAEASAGPANLYQQREQALVAVEQCVDTLLRSAGIGPQGQSRVHAGLGLAGAELPSARQLVAGWQPPWASVQVVNDAHVACLGAHQGQDGGLVVVGTGIVGWAIRAGQGQILDGWGFPLADQGSGAWLGQRALQLTLRASDGMVPETPLTRHLLARFADNPRRITEWAATARSGDYAHYARTVVEYADQGDAAAETLLQEQAREVGLLVQRLLDMHASPVALLGGLAPAVSAHLPAALTRFLVPAREDAIAGALYFIRQNATRSEDSIRP